jgi:hypothetical protein
LIKIGIIELCNVVLVVQAAFFAKTKEPFPEFAEVSTEKVVGPNAKENSQGINVLV